MADINRNSITYVSPLDKFINERYTDDDFKKAIGSGVLTNTIRRANRTINSNLNNVMQYVDNQPFEVKEHNPSIGGALPLMPPPQQNPLYITKNDLQGEMLNLSNTVNSKIDGSISELKNMITGNSAPINDLIKRVTELERINVVIGNDLNKINNKFNVLNSAMTEIKTYINIHRERAGSIMNRISGYK